MSSGRLRGYLDATGVVLGESALLVFFVQARGLLGSVDLAHFLTWAQQSSPEPALTALVRLLGICVSAWLLFSTAMYGVGVLTGSRRLLERSRVITPALVRRILDTLAAASVAASSIGGTAALAGASSASHIVGAVRPGSGPQPPGKFVTSPMATSPAPARVSVTALGRHFPHPGEVPHGLPPAASGMEEDEEVPSPGNGFAGLPAGTKVIVVQPGDCLSVLAERHLGDWRLDTEIEALNYGRAQPDGRALVDDHWIYPGWVLVMPAKASGATVVGESSMPALAPKPAAPAPAAPAPAPADPAPARAVPAPVVPAPSPGPVVTAPAPGVTAPVVTAPAPVAPARPPGARPGPVARAALRPAGARGTDVSKGHDDNVVAVLAIGAVAAAGALWRLDGMRRELRHDRPRGWAIARNRVTVEAAERRSRAVADSQAMRWVDLGLRYLSGLVEQVSSEDHANIPSLVLVKVGKAGLEIVLSPPPKGRLGWFSPTADGAGLVLDSDLEIEDLELLAADHWPAWPVVVSLGESDEGTVLVNLEYAGSVSVEGDSKVVRGALGAILLQLVSQPWSQEMLGGLYAVGEPTLDDRLAPVQRVPGDKAMDLAEKLDNIAEAREEVAGDLSLSALRAMACEALPNVVVAFAGTPDGARQCLAEAALPERSGVVLVGAGPITGARWRLVLGRGDGLLEGNVEGCPTSWKLRTGWDLEEVALVAEALGTATDRDGAIVVATPATAVASDELVDVRTDGEGPHEAQRAHVEILVLGPVDVAGGEIGAVEPSRRMAALGLLAYMASHDRPVSADQLAGSLWPLDATKDNVGGPQRKTVMNVISRARAVLGYGAGGHERLVHTPQGYRLAEDVSSDWARFEKLVGRARSQPPHQAMAVLRRALELVRGEPFSGALSSQFFEWVASEHLDLTFSAKIVDVAQDLGELALEAEDYETVLWAVEKGLLLEPTREEMFRLWMHALGRMGRPGGVDDVYRRLKLVLRQRIHPLQEPQPGSYSVWRTYTAGELTRTPG
ncbi:MAG: BTAD domain-containing putative transcriptional regulator [Acidimicrobiales bacterium]